MRIEVSGQARKKLLEIGNYILTDFGEAAYLRFNERLNKALIHLSRFPESGERTSVTTKRNLRRYVVHSRLSILYDVKADSVIIKSVKDNRQKSF